MSHAVGDRFEPADQEVRNTAAAASLTRQDPGFSGTDVSISCTGTTQAGEPAAVEGTCPAAQLLGTAASAVR